MNDRPKEKLEKQILLQNIDRQIVIRKFVLPLLAIVLLFFNVFFPPTSMTILGSFLVIVSFSLFFFGAFYVKKTPNLTVASIQQILVNIVFLELLSAWAGFYFFEAVIASWLIPVAFPALLFFVFYLVLIAPLLKDLYRTFFYLASWLGITFLILLNHSQALKAFQSARLNTEMINSPGLVSIILAGLAIFGVKIIVNYVEDQSQWWSGGFKEVSLKLQERLLEKDESIFRLREELKETKEILQIRTLARAKELKELTQKFQKIVEQPAKGSWTQSQKEQLKEAQETTKALLNVLEDSEKSRKQLAKEKDLTTTIIDNFVDGLIILDAQGIIQEVNQKAQTVFKIKGTDVQGQPLIILRKYSSIAPAVKLIFPHHQVALVHEKDFSPKPGTTFEVSTVALESKGSNLGFLTVFHDVSREKHIQKMKTDFVSIVAHQLRTPLSAIKWSIKMILDGELGKVSAQQKDWLDKTYQSNERMITLVNDLLNVSRIEEGRFLYNLQETDLREIINNVLHNNADLIQRKHLKITFRGKTKKIPKVKVDAEKLQLAVQNLITNAIHYTPDGGGITVAIDLQESNLLVSVKDNGIGISKADQAKVFQRFFRARNAIKTRTNGTGLGLFITKNIIEAHHGKIWFTSKLGKGTTFYFTLPY